MNLFVIGNGFDIKHKLPTEYIHFREYLSTEYPGSDEYDELVPESTIDNHGEVRFDMADVAGYVSRIIDNCEKGDWSDLESYLGNAIFYSFDMDLETVDMDAPDKDTMRAVYHNESLSSNIRDAFSIIKRFFCDWVNDYLASLKYEDLRNSEIAEVIAEGDAFLSFNYTMTLEKVYGVHDVCHIHGMIGDKNDDIIFGHGDDSEYPESFESLGADYSFNELKKSLRKDTSRAFYRHKVFFDSLVNVETIHSFGFSFANVDMFYIEEIARRAPGATWFLNNHTAEQDSAQEIITKLQELGFEVKRDNRW